MSEIHADISQRFSDYCRQFGLEVQELRGYGVDGYVWQTKHDSILKVFRHEGPFRQELAVYQRLRAHRY